MTNARIEYLLAQVLSPDIPAIASSVGAELIDEVQRARAAESELRETIEAAEATHDDEEAAHQETLDLLTTARAEVERLRAVLRELHEAEQALGGLFVDLMARIPRERRTRYALAWQQASKALAATEPK